MFVRCFGAYYIWIQNASSILSPGHNVSPQRQPDAIEPSKQMDRLSNHPQKECPLGSTSSMSHLGICDTYPHSKLQLLEALTLSLHQCTFVLATADGSGASLFCMLFLGDLVISSGYILIRLFIMQVEYGN